MTWFKVDDKLWGHPKWMALPAGARALWVTAGSYCASNETDGRLSAATIAPLGGRPRDADRLVECGLWERVEGGYQFHDWADYQPTKAQVRAERDATKERQRKWREARQSRRDNTVSNAVTNTSRHTVSNAAPTRPDPTNTPLPPNHTPPPDDKNSLPANAGGDFDEFWTLYPKRQGKDRARAAWRHATRDTPPTEILNGLRTLLPKLEAADPQFIPHPNNWLRDRRWTDQPPDTEPDPWAHMTHLNPRPKDPA